MIDVLSMDMDLHTVFFFLHKMKDSELNLLTLGMQNIRTCLASLLDPTDALELIHPSGGTSQGCLHQVHFYYGNAARHHCYLLPCS